MFGEGLGILEPQKREEKEKKPGSDPDFAVTSGSPFETGNQTGEALNKRREGKKKRKIKGNPAARKKIGEGANAWGPKGYG